MLRFTVKAALFTIAILATIFGVIYLAPLNKDKYIYALVDKHRMLDTVPGPRLIFTSDSNLAYGLNSARIKEATGYNVINMGLHGGLGLIYCMDELKGKLRKGDIVIFVPDYTHYVGEGGGADTLVDATIAMPSIMLKYSRENYGNYLANVPLTFQRRLRGAFSPSIEDPAHRRSSFNEYGDNVGHLNLPPPKFKTIENMSRFLPERINDRLVKRLNDFTDRCRAQGVDVYIMFSPVMLADRVEQEPILASLAADMRKRLHMKVVGDPLNYLYPREIFYDNEFHLNGKGREIRTSQVIEDLKTDPLLSSAKNR